MSKMISSCSKCKTKCCSFGPGPWKSIIPEEYIENFSSSEAYNTKCMALDSTGRCSLWKTAQLPVECRTYICHTRSYTKKELSLIEKIDDRFECPKCSTQYVIRDGDDFTCDNCDYEN